MNVLILHQHFKTPQEGGALRSYFLAKVLADRGDKVRVVTGSDYRSYTVKLVDGIEVHHLQVRYSNYYGFWKRIFSFLKYLLLICRNSQRYGDAGICYAISVPLTIGLAARWLKWRYGIPYIFEVGDLWPDAPIELGVIQNSFLKNRLWLLERKIYEQAASVIALSPSIHDAIAKKISGKKIWVIPNMADTEFFRPESKQPSLESKFGVEGKFVIAYLGAMGFANGLEYLLSGAEACALKNLSVHFILAGDGVERDKLKRQAELTQLKNVSFFSFQSREAIRELMNVTDAVFVCYRHALILETGSPNKFFDGLAAGKLIMVNFGGWIKQEVEEAQCGFYVDPENADSIVEPLREIISGNTLTQYQVRSRELAEKFALKKLTREWLVILDRHYHNRE